MLSAVQVLLPAVVPELLQEAEQVLFAARARMAVASALLPAVVQEPPLVGEQEQLEATRNLGVPVRWRPEGEPWTVQPAASL